MNRDNALLVAGIVDRITKLEQTILELEQLKYNETFTIIGKAKHIGRDTYSETVVELKLDEIATVVFTQDILELYISTLNLELCELVKSLEEF